MRHDVYCKDCCRYFSFLQTKHNVSIATKCKRCFELDENVYEMNVDNRMDKWETSRTIAARDKKFYSNGDLKYY